MSIYAPNVYGTEEPQVRYLAQDAEHVWYYQEGFPDYSTASLSRDKACQWYWIFYYNGPKGWRGWCESVTGEYTSGQGPVIVS